jgi:hypothetical protein
VCGSDEPLPGFHNPACGTIAGSYFGLYLQTANRILHRQAQLTLANKNLLGNIEQALSSVVDTQFRSR